VSVQRPAPRGIHAIHSSGRHSNNATGLHGNCSHYHTGTHFSRLRSPSSSPPTTTEVPCILDACPSEHQNPDMHSLITLRIIQLLPINPRIIPPLRRSVDIEMSRNLFPHQHPSSYHPPPPPQKKPTAREQLTLSQSVQWFVISTFTLLTPSCSTLPLGAPQAGS